MLADRRALLRFDVKLLQFVQFQPRVFKLIPTVDRYGTTSNINVSIRDHAASCACLGARIPLASMRHSRAGLYFVRPCCRARLIVCDRASVSVDASTKTGNLCPSAKGALSVAQRAFRRPRWPGHSIVVSKRTCRRGCAGWDLSTKLVFGRPGRLACEEARRVVRESCSGGGAPSYKRQIALKVWAATGMTRQS